jgi:uncharacterized protein YbaP (TraB family)
MNRSFLIGKVLLLLAIASQACAEVKSSCPPVAVRPTPEMIQAGMRDARDHGFLWRVSRDGHSSYLYGTIHVGKQEWMFPGPGVMQAIRASDSVALELDMLDPDIQRRMAAGMATMRSVALPDALVKRLRKQAESVCVPFDAVARLSPEMQVVMLTLMDARWEGLDASYGIDGVLAGLGRSAGKAMLSLETPEAQIKLLQMQDEQGVVTFVGDGLSELESGRAGKSLRQLAQVWSSSDYSEMGRYSEWCDCLKTQAEREMMKKVLDDRNPNLADRIDEIHSGGKKVFAAVGSLHMFGVTGLPAQMSRRGYRVERVDLKTH